MKRVRGRDRGQVAVEYLGFLPILLLIGLAGVQLGIVAYAAQQAGTGARAAARADSVDDRGAVPDPGVAGKAAMSGWIAGRSDVEVAGGVATVTVRIPSLIPFLDMPSVSKSATMPVPDSAPRLAPDSGPRSGPDPAPRPGPASVPDSAPEEDRR